MGRRETQGGENGMEEVRKMKEEENKRRERERKKDWKVEEGKEKGRRIQKTQEKINRREY